MSTLQNKTRFKDRLEQVFDAFKGRTNSSALPDFIGARYRNPLEHTTRRYLVDDIVTGLGWDISRLTRDMVEEARVQGDTTLFMDYLGVNPGLRVPLLIIEAKAWAKPFIMASNTGIAKFGARNDQNPDGLIAAAIEHCKSGGSLDTSPVIHEWAEWIHKLHQYVNAVHQESRHKVKRVAITAGRWMIILTNPSEAFIGAGAVNTTSIKIFRDDEVIHRSDEIYDSLAREILDDDSPEYIEPAQLSAYVGGADAVRLFRALWIARRRDGAHFDTFPQINIYPAVIVQRSNDKLIPVIDHLRERIQLPHKYADLAAHIAEVSRAIDLLLQTVNSELGINAHASPLSSFSGFPLGSRLNTATTPSPAFIKSSAMANDFLLVTGAESHYLLPQATVLECAGHSWSACYALHDNQTAAAIIGRSFDPASFFITDESHHCAHRQIHQRRDSRCHLLPFEEYLCCRACVFQASCWTQTELDRLPCGIAVAALDAPPSLQTAHD